MAYQPAHFNDYASKSQYKSAVPICTGPGQGLAGAQTSGMILENERWIFQRK